MGELFKFILVFVTKAGKIVVYVGRSEFLQTFSLCLPIERNESLMSSLLLTTCCSV